MTLGTKLRKLRDNKKLSQIEISNLLGVSQSAYNKWEADHAKPSVDNLLKISNYYQTDLYELLDKAPYVSIFNNEFNDNSNAINQYYPTIYMQSPEIIEGVLKNQENITKLIEVQNKLLKNLLDK